MSAARKRLEKAGWRLVSHEKRGLIHIIKWHDPIDGYVWSQGYALSILKSREQITKLREKQCSANTVVAKS